MKDFKTVYKVVNEVEALSAFDFVEEKWAMRYRNWDSIYNQLSIYFEGRL